MRRAPFAALLSIVALVLVAATAGPDLAPSVGPGGRPVRRHDASTEPGRASLQEAEDPAGATADRLAALANARTSGAFATTGAATSNPAPGWVGERVLGRRTDDWEPAVAADPNAPYVYMLTTRYGAPPPCPHHCPSPWLGLAISKDDGVTWSKVRPLCACYGMNGQWDPTIEVVADTGAVYAAFLAGDRHNGFSTVFTRSNDHGRSWSDPIHVYGKVSWTDKPEIATGADGRDVYASWNGTTGGDLWIGQSHDGGRTWTQTRVVDSKRYFFAYDADVLPDGTAIFSESSLTYTGSKKLTGEVWHHAIVSHDRGATWENVIVAKVPVGEACVAEGCGPDYYTGQTSVSSDTGGRLVFAYEGPKVDLGPQQVFVRTSADGGRTWSPRTSLSTPGENATNPRLAATGNGDVRMFYMQTSRGDNPDAWNTWYRSSSDGGTTWTSPVKISDASSGAGYKTAAGFLEPYGDYGEIDITSNGKTIAAWGEGFSWTGPGGTWFNVQG